MLLSFQDLSDSRRSLIAFPGGDPMQAQVEAEILWGECITQKVRSVCGSHLFDVLPERCLLDVVLGLFA